MTTPLSAELEKFIEHQVTLGHFANRIAVLEAALRLLQADREDAVLGIRAGLADVAAGRTQPIANVFEELRRYYP